MSAPGLLELGLSTVQTCRRHSIPMPDLGHAKRGVPVYLKLTSPWASWILAGTRCPWRYQGCKNWTTAREKCTGRQDIRVSSCSPCNGHCSFVTWGQYQRAAIKQLLEILTSQKYQVLKNVSGARSNAAAIRLQQHTQPLQGHVAGATHVPCLSFSPGRGWSRSLRPQNLMMILEACLDPSIRMHSGNCHLLHSIPPQHEERKVIGSQREVPCPAGHRPACDLGTIYHSE